MRRTILLTVCLLGPAVAYGVIPDDDGDGYPQGIDCDDTNAAIHPQATETPYDGIDQDCNGRDLCDVDLDGFDGEGCGGPDCDDNNHGTSPAAVDVPGNGVDEDCSGADAERICDADGDGVASLVCGGEDCNDLDATVHPGATEIFSDGIDQDCDTIDQCEPVSWVMGGPECAVAGGATSTTGWLLAGLLGLALRRRRASPRPPRAQS